ncbi:Syntaxin-18, partial [Nibea albiflora]
PRNLKRSVCKTKNTNISSVHLYLYLYGLSSLAHLLPFDVVDTSFELVLSIQHPEQYCGSKRGSLSSETTWFTVYCCEATAVKQGCGARLPLSKIRSSLKDLATYLQIATLSFHEVLRNITNITKLKDFLLQHRKDYVSAGSECVLVVTAAEKQVTSAQIREHRGAVLDLIEMYLRGVCKLYSEQRAIRVKRMVDKKRLSRLAPEHHSRVEKTPEVEPTEEKTVKEESSEKSVSEVPENPVNMWEESRVEDELSPEEIQMFEQENQRLVSEMNSLVDEVRQIEGKVVEISRLQEIFAEKVLQQETEIDNIHQLVVGATENVKEGNEDIREVKNKPIYSAQAIHALCNQKQRWLPGMDPVLPGHVLFLSPLPGLAKTTLRRNVRLTMLDLVYEVTKCS